MKEAYITIYGRVLRVYENGDIYSVRRTVSYSNGRVHRYNEYKMKPFTDRYGYLCINMSQNGHLRKAQVHRIMALAFIPNPDNLPCINHKDENKKNNNIDNLEWCTVYYNNHYNGRYERTKYPGHKCAAYRDDGTLVGEFRSVTQAAKIVGVNRTTIDRCLRGIQNTSGGYIWKSLKKTS